MLYTFSDQLWTICMEFSKSATNFDSPHAESCPNGRRNTEPPKLLALFPNCMHCRLTWPEKGVYEYCTRRPGNIIVKSLWHLSFHQAGSVDVVWQVWSPVHRGDQIHMRLGSALHAANVNPLWTGPCSGTQLCQVSGNSGFSETSALYLC